eukprot:JZ547924.1.p4 GENE.JZ547924.1~~JZ547924.1.p4  ORF type:complete len:84 (-),score=5.28 JZ547924.1:396-647(-)
MSLGIVTPRFAHKECKLDRIGLHALTRSLRQLVKAHSGFKHLVRREKESNHLLQDVVNRLVIFGLAHALEPDTGMTPQAETQP